MNAANPFNLAHEIAERYARYLKTTFYFKDTELRRSFEAAVDSGSLVNGPFLESTPVYRRRSTSRDLLTELLRESIEAGFLAAMHPDRRLYAHQEEAIRRVERGRNIVVATGTGSGKTEAYVYPILLHLLRETLRGERRPGVRALILYPMNALANDQRRRLGEYWSRFRQTGSRFSFTFGQYTGDTPEDERDSRRYGRQREEDRLGGELVFRAEMREQPPDILLTNYSMLEYLLLRPADSPLFDDGRGAAWHFLVLDEAHQYRGSKGMEMAMLLRRLGERLRRGGCQRPLRCIATSASLGGIGGSVRAAVARFAAELFGEAFEEQDIIVDEREDPPAGLRRLPTDAYEKLLARDGEYITSLAGSAPNLPGVDLDGLCRELLEQDSRVAELHRALHVPRPTRDIADEVFRDAPEGGREGRLAVLVDLLTRTPARESEAPLLSVRYHFFLRSLEGAFVQYHPDKRVHLERGSQDDETDAVSFEVALCKECGQHYLVGVRKNGRLCEALRDRGSEEFRVSFFRPLDNRETAESDDDDEEGQGTERRTAWLCLTCGALSEAARVALGPPCAHHTLLQVFEEPERRGSEDQARKCGACGYEAQDPVREVVHGTDGPNAVVATTLHRSLPHERRKVLAFVDGRQEAAFFAWYVGSTYETLRDRNLLLACARDLRAIGRRPVSLRTLARRVRDELRARGVAAPSRDDLDVLRQAWIIVYREFATDEPRLSLQGLGLLRYFPELGDFQIPEVLLLPPWSLDRGEARDLVSLLLDTMRSDFAVELSADPGVALRWDDLHLRARQRSVQIGAPGRRRDVRAWDGVRGRRVGILSRLLQRSAEQLDEQARVRAAQDVLRQVWDRLRRGPTDGLLLRSGDAMHLNPDWWRVEALPNDGLVFRCNVCGRVQPTSVRDVCVRPGCVGSLSRVAASDTDLTSNHYRLLYAEELPATLRAEEHTAQIDKEKAREFQLDFEHGRIQLLSCSTTFELGVDLGDLDTIFLRNMPPEPFNYAQRVGRAGRRPGHPGFAVTYYRRRPHDLAYFLDPQPMLEGRTRPAVLRVTNEKIVQRHLCAMVLSEFFRAYPERFTSVQAFSSDFHTPRGSSDVRAFLSENRSRLEEILITVVPPRMHGRLGLRGGGWIDTIFGNDSRLILAEAEVCSDYQMVSDLEQAFVVARKYGDAEWARDRAATIAGEDVISFLSRKAVIPKYGFPVDVVELDLQGTRSRRSDNPWNVSLQRDLAIAIAEFAPGSKLVANKKVFTSYGLKRVIGREWPRWRYLKCATHGTFMTWAEGSASGTACCDAARPGTYVDPIFGFVSERTPPEDPVARPLRVLTTRPYFSRSQCDEVETIEIETFATLTKASPGYLVVVCEGKKGQGFSICRDCGGAVAGRARQHKTPQGRDCSGRIDRVALGHEFLTDVVRIQFRTLPGLPAPAGDVWFGHSLAYALLHGTAEVLEVPPSDLSVTVRGGGDGSLLPEIILYDNVPGGAGLVARLEQPAMFRQVLEEARLRVSGCRCGQDTSCEGCLRSYTNQFAHPYLARGPVAQYLETLLQLWR